MKVKVFIPINDYDSRTPVVSQEGQFDEIRIESIREIEYDCWKVNATEKFLHIYQKTPTNYPVRELLACFNWDKIIGYEVIEFSEFDMKDIKNG